MSTGVDYDVLIAGGGPIGAALALALDDSGLSVALVEPSEQTRSNDPRTLALSSGSRLILEQLGVWHRVTPVTPIEHIHVSQRGTFGRALLHAKESGLPALGYVVSFSALHEALTVALAQRSRVARLTGVRATDLEADTDAVRVELEGGSATRDVRAKLAVIADGGATLQAHVHANVRDYGQSAVVANVVTSRPHENTAFERFTTDGPLALLPRENGYALIWTMAPALALEWCERPALTFLTGLQQTFGDRAGRFLQVDARAAFPLALRVAAPPTIGRTVLIGNAAQTLHPVAGQGLNLGLRDALELAACLRAADKDPGRREVLSNYLSRRRNDRASGVFFTDALVRIFSDDAVPQRWLRGWGLTFLDCAPLIKRAFVRQMMFGRPY